MAPKTIDLKAVEKISKALGDRHRLNILNYITRKGGCAQCSDLHEIIDLSQPSVSHHIKILTEAGLIEAEKSGRNFSYTLNTKVLDQYTKFLKDLQND
ncbi:MAG TPA: metalloregulator ArsR/SmtB family transcription factor [Chryseosolibacter sp.]